MKTPNENEVKIRLADRSATEKKIATLGFSVSAPRVFEANTLYDTPEQTLRNKKMLLRLRQVKDSAVITWKGPSEPGPHKNRPELETNIGSVETLAQILTQLGYQRTFRYEKYRTEFSTPDSLGVVTVDETPIGDFMELEGPPDWVDHTAATLGFTKSEYILDSYGKLYLADCERRGVQPTNMVFTSPS